MRLGKLGLLPLALTTGCAGPMIDGPAASPATSEAEVRRLEESWTAAFNAGDARLLEQVMAPEFTLVTTGDSKGIAFTPRESWMRVWKNANRYPYRAKVLRVTVAGDTAVATIEASWRRNSYLTDTWTRRNGRWQLAARHSAVRP